MLLILRPDSSDSLFPDFWFKPNFRSGESKASLILSNFRLGEALLNHSMEDVNFSPVSRWQNMLFPSAYKAGSVLWTTVYDTHSWRLPVRCYVLSPFRGLVVWFSSCVCGWVIWHGKFFLVPSVFIVSSARMYLWSSYARPAKAKFWFFPWFSMAYNPLVASFEK